MTTAGDSHKCQFGNWLDNEGHRLMPSKRHDEIRAAHDDFHRIAAEILQKIREKRFDEVRADISSDGAFNQATNLLTELLSKDNHTTSAEPSATETRALRSPRPNIGITRLG